ncbi:MAG TPA: FixH family protein [Sphingobacteriaceae bacterium]
MNWGKKIIIGMASFIIFMVSLGAIMIMRNDNDALIEDDYYQKGIAYDKDYDAKKAAIDDMVVPAIHTNDMGVTITFPVPVKYQLICRRLADYHMDKTFNGYTDEDRNIQIPKGMLEPGPWLLRIQYTAEDKNYLFEGEIVMP